jgi:protein-S-isoprenylcysteine O-methyltransferase Ste14
MPSLSDIARNILIGFVIFLLLPLTAWGFDDLSNFFEHDSRQGYVVMIVFLAVMQILHLRKYKEVPMYPDMGVERENTSLQLLRIIPLAVILVAPYCDRHNLSVMEVAPWVRNCGLALFALGMIILHEAESAVGRPFCIQNTIQKEYRFDTNGIYRYLRRPMDLGAIMVTLGMSLAFRSWLGLALTGGFVLVFVNCIHREERIIHERRPDDWECYSEHTWRLIPYIY